MATGPGLRADASYGDRQAGAALAIMQRLAPEMRRVCNLHSDGWNSFIELLVDVYGAGDSPDAAEVRRVLESMRASADE